MKALALGLLALLIALPLRAEEANDKTVRELLAVTQTQKLMDGMIAQMDAMMQASMKQALAGRTVSPDQQRILDDTRAQMVALFKNEMAWETFEPLMIDIYRKTFTEEEVKGMLDFYKSPAGQAVIAKMPAVMQASMQMAQSRMGAMMPKMKKIQDDAMGRLKAAPSASTTR